jgi:hypothetical protein
MNSLRDQIKYQAMDQMKDQIEGQTIRRLRTWVRSGVWEQLFDQIVFRTRDQIILQVDAQAEGS